jgi:polysaccharide chain length determinant protein (PEP-CTERM system associated)
VTDSTGRDSGLRPDLVLDVWQRRKWIAAVVLCAVSAAAVTTAASLPDLYQTSATVLVERPDVSEAFVRPSVTAELETRIKTIDQRVMSRERLTEVITRLGLYPELRGVVPMERIVDRMRRDVIPLTLTGVDQASGRIGTIAFTLGYRGRDPWTVAQVTNTLVGYYVAENSSTRERQAERTAEFLAEQLAEVKRELDDQERLTNDFTLRHTVELPEQIEANLAALDRLNTQLRLNGEYLLRAIERRERFEQELSGTDNLTAAGEATAANPAEELRTLKRRLAELRRRYSDQYPDVRRAEAEVAALERQIAGTSSDEQGDSPAGRVGSIRQGLANVDEEVAALRLQDSILRKTIAEYESRVENAPRRQQEIQQLSRGYEMSKERYEALLKRYEDARLAARLEQGHGTEQFRVLDPAVPPTQPAAPDRMWLVIMGVAAAIGLAIGAVLLFERLDSTFHTADDLNAFVNVPALVTIRQIVTQEEQRHRRQRFALLAASAVAGIAVVVGASYYVASGNEQIVQMTARGAM